MIIDHWTKVEEEALQSVSSLAGAADVAITILSRMNETGREVVQICGPMSTGGLGSFTANMTRFRLAIDKATEHGLQVFDQIPFQQTIIRLCDFKEEQTHYNWDVLENFYRKIFESGHVHRGLFLPDWHSSTGAKWEYHLMARLGLIVEEYPAGWLLN